MSDVRGIKARIGSARMLLQEHASSPLIGKLSEIQATALVKILSDGQLDADAKAELSVLTMTVPWAHPDHAASVLEVCSSVGVTLPVGKRRRTSQDYKSVCNYGSEEFWAHLKSTTTPPSAKLSSICQLTIHLGLRCPTEPTLKLMCSLWQLTVAESQALAKQDIVTKQLLLKHTKTVFDAQRRNAADPVSWVTKLPESPAEFCRDHRVLFVTTFPDGTLPVAPPPVDITALVSYDSTYGCRGGTKGVTTMQAPTAPPPVVAAIGPNDATERVANQFMASMQAMSQGQQRMLECLMMTSGHGNQRVPKAMGALDMFDSSMRQRVQPPMQPSLCERPALSNTSLVISPVSDSPDTQPPMVPSPIVMRYPVSDVASPRSAASVDDMLDMVAERKNNGHADPTPTPVTDTEPAAIAVTASTVAAGSGTNGTAANVKVGPVPKITMAEPIIKVNGKTGTNKGKAKAKPANAKSTLSGASAKLGNVNKGSTKHGPTKGTPATSGKGKDIVYGCSKCRFKSHGCVRCWNPGYNGLRWNEHSK